MNRGSGKWGNGLGVAATRSSQLLLCAAVVALLTWLIVHLRTVTIPVMIACIAACALWPLVSTLRERGWRPALAAAGTFFAGLSMLTLVGWIVAIRVYGEWDDLKRSAGEGLEELRQLITSVLPIDSEQLQAAQADLAAKLSSDDTKTQAVAGATLAGEIIVSGLLFAVVLFLLLKDGPAIWNFAQKTLPASQHRRAQRIGARSRDVLGSYVRGTAAVAAVDAILIGIALALLGVPLVLALSVLVFVGGFIPVVGATVAGMLAALVALVSQGPGIALAVIAVVIVVNQVEGNFLAPVILSNAVALHPLAILLTLSTGAVAAGVIGALLSVPLLAVLWTVIQQWDEPHDEAPGTS